MVQSLRRVMSAQADRIPTSPHPLLIFRAVDEEKK
jgi:hypothetical protein